MSTGYEIIKGNLNFTGPERIGLRFDRTAGISDVYRIFVLPGESHYIEDTVYNVKKKARPVSGLKDEWGCLWASEDATGSDMGQVKNVAIADWDDYEDYVFPDPYEPGRWEGLEEALAEAESLGKYVQLNSPHCIFERMHFLRGFEDTLMDILVEPDYIADMAEKLADFQIGIIKEAHRLSNGRIHCYDTTDDWGAQKNLMISPDSFREIFLPQYRRVFQTARGLGMDIRFHSDGNYLEIIPDLIDSGVNMLNIHQPLLMGIDNISKAGQGKVCFEVTVDIQATLPKGDKAEIEDQVKQMVEKLATPEGGLIGIEYGYLGAIGVTPEAMHYSLEMFQKYGQFK